MSRTVNAQSTVTASNLRYMFISHMAHRARLAQSVRKAEKAFTQWEAHHAKKTASASA